MSSHLYIVNISVESVISSDLYIDNISIESIISSHLNPQSSSKVKGRWCVIMEGSISNVNMQLISVPAKRIKNIVQHHEYGAASQILYRITNIVQQNQHCTASEILYSIANIVQHHK